MCSEPSNLTFDISVSAPQSNCLEHILENSNDLLSYQTDKYAEKIVDCGFTNVLFLIGAPTNILTMIVFHRQGLRDRMNLCLFCLAFVDLMYLTTLFIAVLYCVLGIAFPDQEEVWKWFITKYCLSFVYGFQYTSGCVTMIIAVERCVCVMFPMKAATLISTKTMAIILLVTFIVIQLLCSVYFIKDNLTVVKNLATGKDEVLFNTTDIYLSHSVFSIIENIVLSSISIATFTVVCLSTAVIVVTLRNASIWRKSTASSKVKGQAMLMRMLVVVSCIYILCTAHNDILALARFTVPEFRADGRYSTLFLATHFVSHIPVMFNSTINFFVYAKMSSRFRQELRSLCIKDSVTLKPTGISAISHV